MNAPWIIWPIYQFDKFTKWWTSLMNTLWIITWTQYHLQFYTWPNNQMDVQDAELSSVSRVYHPAWMQQHLQLSACQITKSDKCTRDSTMSAPWITTWGQYHLKFSTQSMNQIEVQDVDLSNVRLGDHQSIGETNVQESGTLQWVPREYPRGHNTASNSPIGQSINQSIN